MAHADRLVARMAAILLAAACSVACEAELMASGPVAVCSEVATQCQLPAGPLGVCERAACKGDATPPCFVCTPQH